MSAESASSLCLVLTTVGSEPKAREIARALIEAHLAACVHLEPIESLYEWQGHLEEAREWRLLIKTTRERYAAVEAAIRERHDYELPAILAVPVTEVFAAFAEWVRAQSAPAVT
ncbi:MAG: divalent-cation tolerance protein CutA [Casimicrobiaceae bacterium]|nr:divalent-cation tolerance protein CutA [Casimicrobiaceae bacterium]MCX8098943.1 divalent-cation tolerance protein CutA [Casimicrobiaceae bacterium]MDW8313132.1 divalent-cation tolerance protein CutA [Burkholderiales bacterium]